MAYIPAGSSRPVYPIPATSTISTGWRRHKAHPCVRQPTDRPTDRRSPDEFLVDVERKLHCTRCGSRAENTVLVTPMEQWRGPVALGAARLERIIQQLP
jgi:hypothetical protein